VKCAARGSLQIQDAKMSPKIAIWAPSHNRGRHLCSAGRPSRWALTHILVITVVVVAAAAVVVVVLGRAFE